MTVDRPRAERAVRELLLALGADPTDAGLARTPERVAAMWEELLAGVGVDPVPALERAGVDAGGAAGPVAFRDVPFRSVCEHHLLPFAGTASIVYLPGRAVAGLGALVAALEALSARPQVQERLTDELAGAVESALGARGVLVHLVATHDCVALRGSRAVGARLGTLAARGRYAAEPAAAEARALAGLGAPPPPAE